jgi:hypothetical protein
MRIHGAEKVQIAPGHRLFAVVRVPFDGAHLKAFVPNRADSDVDVPEDIASALFEYLSKRTPELGVLESELRRRSEETEA